MIIDGEKFKIIDVFGTTMTIPDCFVMRQNKIGTGNGEAKLYISSKQTMHDFYGEEGFCANCFILKDDLIAYMNSIKGEYLNPTQNYRGKDDLPELWAKRMAKIESLPNVINFQINDQNHIEGERGYVNSIDEGYKLIRELALPLVSYISVLQLSNKTKTPVFYWKIFADFDAIADKKLSLVYMYGKKEIECKQDNKTIRIQEEIRKARIGQGKYRELLLEECPFCPITRINDDRLLIASHIKPWASSDDNEKIDSKNGFILSPLYDKLFDRGFMSFTDDKRIIISNWISPSNKKRLGIKEDQYIQLLPIDEHRKKYLQFHRTMVFKG